MYYGQYGHNLTINMIFLIIISIILCVSSRENCKDTDTIATVFKWMKPIYDKSSCPKEAWLQRFSQVNPSRVRNMINIGFNKGYNMANWISIWAPESGVNNQLWYVELKKQGIDDCGFCDDCNLELNEKKSILAKLSSKRSSRKFVIIGIDLNVKNVDTIDKIKDSFLHKLATFNVSIHTIHAGASNIDGSVKVMKCEAGDELCAITMSSNMNESVLIPAVTVDTLTRNLTVSNVLNKEPMIHKNRMGNTSTFSRITHSSSTASAGNRSSDNIWQEAEGEEMTGKRLRDEEEESSVMIDILQIDTEGYDVLVLQGARQTLASHRVRMLMFEYNNNPPWSDFTLQSVIQELEGFSYDCYFSGQGRLWKISGCWHSVFETRAWMNVLCLLRNDPWHRIAEKYYRVGGERQPLPKL